MILLENNNDKLKLFSDLKLGATFRTTVNEVIMKIPYVSSNKDDYNDTKNAVVIAGVRQGTLLKFYENDIVSEIEKVKITIY